jgi:hypothetical protein
MSRIATRFAKLKADGRGALVTFLTGFDPDRATSLAILRGLPTAGADVIEIGVPFTDPMADGPSVQKAGQRGLKAGATVPGILDLVREFRTAEQDTPVVLMGYLNPILAYGVERFCADAAAAGVDGLIIVDVPPEEADEVEPQARANGLDLIRLVAPTTDEARLPRVLGDRLHLLRLDHRHHRHAQRRLCLAGAGGGGAEAAHRPAGGDRLRHPHAGTGRGRRDGGRWRGGRHGAGRCPGRDARRRGPRHGGHRAEGAGQGRRPGAGDPGGAQTGGLTPGPRFEAGAGVTNGCILAGKSMM